jgi:MoxR-like ATPase
VSGSGRRVAGEGATCCSRACPGVAKTLLVKTSPPRSTLDFKRVQFTPDLMPSDVTGQTISTAAGGFRFREGPVFTNLLLADEINRTPPKTQASLLEAMEERQVSVEGRAVGCPTRSSSSPRRTRSSTRAPTRCPRRSSTGSCSSCSSATRPSTRSSEVLAVTSGAGSTPTTSSPPACARSPRLPISHGRAPRSTGCRSSRRCLQYLVALCRATRETPSVQLGVSPRGAAALLHAAKAWAWLSGRPFVTPDEVKAVAKPVLRHRMLIRPELELEGTTADGVLDGSGPRRCRGRR